MAFPFPISAMPIWPNSPFSPYMPPPTPPSGYWPPRLGNIQTEQAFNPTMPQRPSYVTSGVTSGDAQPGPRQNRDLHQEVALPNPLPPLSKTAYAPEIYQALQLLGQIQHLPQDEAHMRQLGLNIIFKTGLDALHLILSKKIRVEFGDMGDSLAHAQWIKEDNLMMINQKYRGDFSKACLYAISEAIYHEAGHAALLGDDRSSIQEESECLALNTLAYRFHTASDPTYAKAASTSRLISDGVALYAKLFFDHDPQKQALVNRIIEKYGTLPPETPDHPIPWNPGRIPLAYQILYKLQVNRTGF